MLAGGERVVVAVSGGADSVALLRVLATLAPRLHLTLSVTHVDHRLRPGSAADADFVRRLGARLGVPVEVVVVDVRPGAGPEAAARVARYAALEAAAERVGAARIAVGHTADDQAETVLMRLLQGAGARGLAGMPPVRGRIIRPLLECRRAEIVAELESAGLSWVEDPTNRDPKYLRNRIRHELLPLLTSAWEPAIVDALNRVALRTRAVVDALDAVAALEIERASVDVDGAVILRRDRLAGLPADVGAEVLRRAAMRAACRDSRAPVRAWAHRGLRRVLAEPPPRGRFAVEGAGIEVSGNLIRVGPTPAAPLHERTLSVPGRVTLPEIGLAIEARLAAATDAAPRGGPDRVVFDAARFPRAVVVRARRPGDRFAAFGGGGRRLKNVLIDAKVPRWARARVPVVQTPGTGGEIVWVAGLRRAAAAPVTAETREVVELRLLPLADAARRE
jgi:tRNA(Ile)-lysidine synthase